MPVRIERTGDQIPTLRDQISLPGAKPDIPHQFHTRQRTKSKSLKSLALPRGLEPLFSP